MGKALEGAALLAGAVGMGVAAFMDPALIASPLFDKIWAGLIISGISMEVSAIAGALTGNRGMNITTRQTSSYRQIVYGQQRIGGVSIYRSTTGNTKNQYNYIIVLAGHEIHNIVNLYLDGRRVIWQADNPAHPSIGYAVRNGIGFGGDAAGGTYIGPNGIDYSFNALVFAEARYGDQLDGDFMTSLQANDPYNWRPDAQGHVPWVAGCAYIYLKVKANAAMFPGEPEVRITVNGKSDILDPREPAVGSLAPGAPPPVPYRGFTQNWALIANDMLTDTQFGLGDPSVNQSQLIAAANVCDEQVPIAIGGTEARYACNHHYDTSVAPGDALSSIMPAAAGRLSRIGGEWFIWPAYWQGPSFNFSDRNFTGSFEWKPYRSYRDLINRVNGTYTAPNFPWNVTGNLYDSNGWYEGQIQNNFPFAFQPTNWPQYAKDVLHGYPTDEYLTQDGGQQLPHELSLLTVLSVSQAQRVGKIFLERNRQQGSGTLRLNLACWQMQPCDTFLFSYAQNGWADKVLEVEAVKFEISQGNGDSPPSVRAEFSVHETAPSVYEWQTSEELSVYDVQTLPTTFNTVPSPPTNVTLLCSSATALVNIDGVVTPRIEVTWDTPEDGYVVAYDIQYQTTGAPTWMNAASVSVNLNSTFIGPVVSGNMYDVRIRSRHASGTTSVWVEVDGLVAGLVLTILKQDGYGIGTLVANAYSDGTASIDCHQFSAYVGQLYLGIFPHGTVTIPGLAQQTLYYVYYNDPDCLGGDVTPIATVNKADFLGKLGAFLIDSIVTPFVGSTSGTRYYPTFGSDLGSRSTTNVSKAFDGSNSTSATVSAQVSATAISNGACQFGGFPAVTLAASSTLTIIVATAITTNAVTAGTCEADVQVKYGSTTVSAVSTKLNTGITTYTVLIPAGVALNTIQVPALANITTLPSAASGGTPASIGAVSLSIYEVFIQA